jgi:hypothetical protein
MTARMSEEEAIYVRCDHCQALPGEPCVGAYGKTHQTRMKAAEDPPLLGLPDVQDMAERYRVRMTIARDEMRIALRDVEDLRRRAQRAEERIRERLVRFDGWVDGVQQ